MLACPGEVGQIHIKTEPQEEEEPLSAIVTLQRQNAEWMERCLELEAENEELKEDKKLRERRGEGEGEEGDWKERGEGSKYSDQLTVMPALCYLPQSMSEVWRSQGRERRQVCRSGWRDVWSWKLKMRNSRRTRRERDGEKEQETEKKEIGRREVSSKHRVRN